ncbi:MAG: o-succinylbenzoate synthase [Elainellaceae cyanobacterium]
MKTLICDLEICPYRRSFARSLLTHHGLWTERQGLIVRLSTENGTVGFGEIAPLPDFGSETLEEAIALCHRLPKVASADAMNAAIHQISSRYPACQFGLGSAWDNLALATHLSSHSLHQDWDKPLPICRLLPTGAAALDAWQEAYEQGDRTFKWKIGVAPVDHELELFQRLMATLPQDIQLRLDANGGLDWDAAQHWLAACDQMAPGRIEFLEQPLSPTDFEAIQQLGTRFQTPIALDESVASLAQLQQVYQAGWRGIVVIKAAIAGFPSAVRSFCQTHDIDVVWSSVFETAIARRAIEQQLIRALPTPPRALGFGVDHWFADSSMNDAQFDAQDWFEQSKSLDISKGEWRSP